jgi:hypothetical protein
MMGSIEAMKMVRSVEVLIRFNFCSDIGVAVRNQ